MGAAMDKALAAVSDAFRPERKEHQARINQACQVRELVINHRYTFQDALARLEARTDWMLEAFDFIVLDNVALNITHERDSFELMQHEATAYEWLLRITGTPGAA